MENKVIGMVTLGLVLTVGILTTIYSEQAFAAVNYGVNAGIGGNGGNGGKGVNEGGVGGICTTSNCIANGKNATGGNGRDSENGGIGTNGASGGIGAPATK